MDQKLIDDKNAAFWDEPCGSSFAKALGTEGRGREAIAKFDEAFFAFYPYLDRFIDFGGIAGKQVLEVGLGYGSVSERLARSGARYTGLDIAKGPVDLVNYRLATSGLTDSRAQVGSALSMPFEDDRFDVVVSIGCLHHTGDLGKAIDEVHRVLKPGGRAVIMVYYAGNYVRWIRYPKETARYILSRSSVPLRLIEGRGNFDKNLDGQDAPETAMVTKSGLRKLMSNFSSCSIESTNFGVHNATRLVPRKVWIALFGRWLGLDLYATAIK